MRDNNIFFNSGSKSLVNRFKLFFKNEYFRNKINKWLVISGCLGNIISWAVLAVFIHPSANNIILHYNVYFGVDVTGNWRLVFILPAVGLFLLIINFLLSIYFYKNKEHVAGYIILTASLLAQISLLIAAFGVIIINY